MRGFRCLSRVIYLRLGHRELREISWALEAAAQVVQPSINGDHAAAAGLEIMATGALNNVTAVVALDRVPDDPPPVGLYGQCGCGNDFLAHIRSKRSMNGLYKASRIVMKAIKSALNRKYYAFLHLE